MKHALWTASTALLVACASCTSPSHSAQTSAPAHVASAEEPEFQIIRLEHAQAVEMAELLNDLIGQAALAEVPQVHDRDRSPSAPQIQVDPRTNSLLVLANQARIEEIKNLIARLDTER